MTTSPRLQIAGGWAAATELTITRAKVEGIVEHVRQSWPEAPLDFEFYNFEQGSHTDESDEIDDGFRRPSRLSATGLTSSPNFTFAVLMLAGDDLPSHCHQLAEACAQNSLDVVVLHGQVLSTAIRFTLNGLDGPPNKPPVTYLSFNNSLPLTELLRRHLTKRAVLADRLHRATMSSTSQEVIEFGVEGEIQL